MTGRLTLKLALPIKSGEIVGGINTGNSVLISRLHTLPATIDIFDAEIAMFEPVLVSNTQNGVLFFNEPNLLEDVIMLTQNGDDSEEKGQFGECNLETTPVWFSTVITR